MPSEKRFKIVGDNDGHEYYIPVDLSQEWDVFTGLDEHDEDAWDVPAFATRIDGSLTFTDPRCD